MAIIRGVTLNADRLGPGFYQGGAPTSAEHVQRAGFDTLVLCAEEIQPPPHALGSLYVIRCPLLDNPFDPLGPVSKIAALAAAEQVAVRLRMRRRVLCTCAKGINRSGLVSALTLRIVTGQPGRDCVHHVQSCRPGALVNPRFVEWLVTL